MIDGKECQLQARGNAKLAEYAGKVVFYRLLADRKFLSDVSVRVGGSNHLYNFQFTPSQAKVLRALLFPGGAPKVPKGVQEIDDRIAWHPILTRCDRIDALDPHI